MLYLISDMLVSAFGVAMISRRVNELQTREMLEQLNSAQLTIHFQYGARGDHLTASDQ
jgi:hypothetical protein